jgi:ATP/ADP translocase
MDRTTGEALFLGLGLLVSILFFVYALRGVMKREIMVRTQRYQGVLAVFWGTLLMCVAATVLFSSVLRLFELARSANVP